MTRKLCELPMTLEDWERAHGVVWSHNDMRFPRPWSNYYRQRLPGFKTMHRLADAAMAWLSRYLKERP